MGGATYLEFKPTKEQEEYLRRLNEVDTVFQEAAEEFYDAFNDPKRREELQKKIEAAMRLSIIRSRKWNEVMGEDKDGVQMH